MRVAVLHAMALSLWRDRAALALAFLLPAVIYAIFALVFSSAAGGQMKIRLAVFAQENEISQELLAGLRGAREISSVINAASAAESEAAVRDGRADAGVAIAFDEDREAPVIVFYSDATREGAAIVAENVMRQLAPSDEAVAADVSRRVINPVNTAAPMQAYFAAGVAMLFLLLSGFQSALTLFEERDSGVLERVAAGPAGIAAVIDGKFMFIVLQGILQTGIILLTAAVFFNVSLGYAPDALFLAAFAAAIAAAGLALGLTTLCRSRAQAHASGTVISLISAALGGSMAPKFLMPAHMQTIGAATPNAIGIDAFASALWKGGGVAAALSPAAILILMGLGGLVVAHLAARISLRPAA